MDEGMAVAPLDDTSNAQLEVATSDTSPLIIITKGEADLSKYRLTDDRVKPVKRSKILDEYQPI